MRAWRGHPSERSRFPELSPFRTRLTRRGKQPMPQALPAQGAHCGRSSHLRYRFAQDQRDGAGGSMQLTFERGRVCAADDVMAPNTVHIEFDCATDFRSVRSGRPSQRLLAVRIRVTNLLVCAYRYRSRRRSLLLLHAFAKNGCDLARSKQAAVFGNHLVYLSAQSEGCSAEVTASFLRQVGNVLELPCGVSTVRFGGAAFSCQ
jgi:hypothetical protein